MELLIVGVAASGAFGYELRNRDATETVTVTSPTTSIDWWMLEPMEFELARTS